MPRTVTALAGEEKKSSQIPVTLVYIGIPSSPVAITDTDSNVYLNRTTGSGSLLPLTGTTTFVPDPLLSVPDIRWANDPILTDMSLTLQNVDSFWTSTLISGAYREAPVEVWQGNISLDPGESPEEATFTGAVLVYSGLLDHLATTATDAALTVVPSYISPQTMQIPHRFFTSEQFKFLPAPNRVLYFGFSEVTL